MRVAVALGASGITSPWRNPVRNQRVGGHRLSWHLQGYAFDLGYERPPELSAGDRKVIALREGFRLVDEYATKKHDHLQPDV